MNLMWFLELGLLVELEFGTDQLLIVVSSETTLMFPTIWLQLWASQALTSVLSSSSYFS